MDRSELPYIVGGAAVIAAVIFYLINRQKNRVLKVEHPYFSQVWLWPPGSHTRWEAELDLSMPGVERKAGISAEATHEEVDVDAPTEAEIAFCKEQMANLDRLFELSKQAIDEAWGSWVKSEMPNDWRTVLSLNGFSVPKDGDYRNPWGVTYFCEPAGCYFCIEFRDGKSHLESVDG